MRYAVEEIAPIVRRADFDQGLQSREVRYLCALFSELAYYHIPKQEIDDRRRAKIWPSQVMKEDPRRRRPGSVMPPLFNISRQAEGPEPFVVVDRGVIAIGVWVRRDVLFIGFRGTKALFLSTLGRVDWTINLRAGLVDLDLSPFIGVGRVHQGFAEEALRISALITEKLHQSALAHTKTVFLTGHSLGGAVAAIARRHLPFDQPHVCLFGAPRYCDLQAYASGAFGAAYAVRRKGDMVPFVPPRGLGYADHVREHYPDGSIPMDPASLTTGAEEAKLWLAFLAHAVAQHQMEAYRADVGRAARAIGARAKLTPLRRL